MLRRDFLKGVPASILSPVPAKSGLVGDGKADDTKALQKLLTSSDVVYLPAGTFRVSKRIKIKGSKRIIGAGSGFSKILWTNKNGGLSVTSKSIEGKVSISGVSFKTTKPSGGTALRINFPEVPSSVWSNVRLEDIEIAGLSHTADYWDKGIQLHNCWSSFCEEVVFRGTAGTRNANIGFHITGQSTGSNLTKGYFYNVKKAVVIEGPSEGLTFRDLIHVNGLIGVQSITTEQNFPPDLKVLESHFNVIEAGIVVSGRSQMNISNNLIYRFGGTVEPFIGIHFTDGLRDVQVVGNQIIDPLQGTGRTIGLKVGQKGRPSNGVIVGLNKFTSLDVGLDINATEFTEHGNQFSDVKKNIQT